MPQVSPRELIGEIRRRTAKTGGWDKDSSWGRKRGLTRAQVDQWYTRNAIPKGWALAMRVYLKGLYVL